MPPESLLLTVSDLPEHWQRSPSLSQPTEVVVREVCCQVEMWSPERSILWRNPCFQLDLYYLQEFKQGQDLDQCCPGKLFSVLNHWDTEFKVLPKKGLYADQPREQLPKWQPWVCIQHLSSQLGIFEESELDSTWAHHRPAFLAATVFPETSEATSCGSGSWALSVISCTAGKTLSISLVLQLFGGLERSHLAPYWGGCGNSDKWKEPVSQPLPCIFHTKGFHAYVCKIQLLVPLSAATLHSVSFSCFWVIAW